MSRRNWLKANGIVSDIIDTEHSTGDVNKMLLGNFVEEYDNDDGDELSLGASADSPQYFGERTMSPESNTDDGEVFNGESLPKGVKPVATDSYHRRAFSASTR